jgi:LysM repeat protein
MSRFDLPLLAFATALCLAACGGGKSLVPRVTPAEDSGGPAVARTPFTQSGGAGTRVAGPQGTPTVAAPAAVATYTVVSGDTPNGIAEKLNVMPAQRDAWVQQLLAMNNTTASGLQVGQVLRLPPSASTSPPPPAPPGLPPSTPRPTGGTPQPAAPVILQLTSPVARDGEVTLRVRAVANTGCSPTHLLPNGGVSGSAGLGPKTVDGSGIVTWVFTVPGNTPLGEGSVRVICAGQVVAAPLVVN